jgi:hypothetical protein
MLSHKTFLTQMALMAAALRTELTDLTIEAYWQAVLISGLREVEFIKATQEYMVKGDFFPKAPELITRTKYLQNMKQKDVKALPEAMTPPTAEVKEKLKSLYSLLDRKFGTHLQFKVGAEKK